MFKLHQSRVSWDVPTQTSIEEEQKLNSLQMHPRRLFHSSEASLVRIHLFEDMDVSVSV